MLKRMENSPPKRILVTGGSGFVGSAVIDELLGRGFCPCSGEVARRTTRVIDQVLGGYYGGRGDDFWNRPQTWPGHRRI